MDIELPALSLLTYPYRTLEPLGDRGEELRQRGREAGAALVWTMSRGRRPATVEAVSERPGGLAMLMILPPGPDQALDPSVIATVDRTRPLGILPFHPHPDPGTLAQVLRRPPLDLGADVTEYLAWRGLGVDKDTAHVIRRIVDLSAELRSIGAVSRSLYLSRRALGRRFMNRGLPVPSHWLQAARLLRVATRLQNTDATVSSIAVDLGYPDGFAVSNQMERLFGRRPSEVRERLGWEWLLEAWLRREAEMGGLMPSGTVEAGGLDHRPGVAPAPPGIARPARRRAPSATNRV
jgi:AraC-like DNA-binding protein